MYVLLYSSLEIGLKKASKIFAQHFSCGSSVTGDDEVVVQGDVTDDIFDLIQKHWPDVSSTYVKLCVAISNNLQKQIHILRSSHIAVACLIFYNKNH